MAGFGFMTTLSTNEILPGSSNTIPPKHLRDPATGVSIHLVNQVTWTKFTYKNHTKSDKNLLKTNNVPLKK